MSDTLPADATTISGTRFYSTLRQMNRPNNRLSPMRGFKNVRGNSVFKPTTSFDEPKPNGKFQQREMQMPNGGNALTWRYCQNMTIPDFGDQLAREK